MKQFRITTSIVCVLLIFMAMTAFAFSPTPSPTPVANQNCHPEFSILISIGEETHSLHEEMIFYNSPGMCADGILHFVGRDGLYEYIEKMNLPCYRLTGEATTGAEAGAYCTDAEVGSFTLYRIEDRCCNYVECEAIDEALLDSGEYLLMVGCSVSGVDGGFGQYAGLCRLAVGDVPITDLPGVTPLPEKNS